MSAPPESFVAVAGTDSSMEYRKLVSAWLPSQDDASAAVSRALRTALALSEPTRSQAATNIAADVLEARTTEECDEVFGALEDSLQALTAVTRADTRLGGLLLKSLLQAYREASPALHASFRGRLLQFVNSLLPPLLPNSLNRDGLVAPASFVVSAADLSGGASDGPIGEAEGDKQLRLDYSLYAMFWRLQQSISAGTLAISRGPHFDSMTVACEAVLAAVQACLAAAGGKVHGKVPYDAEAAPAPLAYFRDPEVLLTHFAPEFDSHGSFKMQVLVQMAFYLSFLERNNKAERQAAILADLLKRVYVELGRIGPHVARQVLQLTANDAQWQAWRTENVKLDPLPAPVEAVAVPGFSEAEEWREALRAEERAGMGNAELTRLWALGASGEEPVVVEPSFESFVDRVLEEADPANDIEKEYQARSKASFQWKMLRAGAGELGSLVHSASNSSNLFRKDVLTISRVLRGIPEPGQEAGRANAALATSQGEDAPEEQQAQQKRAREEGDEQAAAEAPTEAEGGEAKRMRSEPQAEVIVL